MLTRDENLTFQNLNDGQVQMAFDQHLDRLIKNCLDPNAGTKGRKLIVTLDVVPNDRRDEVAIKVSVDSKLLNTRAFQTAATMGVDSHGRGVMREYQRQQPLLQPFPLKKEDSNHA